MGQVRFRLLLAVVAVLVAAPAAGAAAGSTSCATRLLADWRDGRIDRTYPVSCYGATLAELPEDVQVYSTARSDITRALQARLAAGPRGESEAQGPRDDDGAGVPLLAVLAISGAVLLAAGSLAASTR
jgi:hypothetical protein